MSATDPLPTKRPPFVKLLTPAKVEALRRMTVTERLAKVFEANRRIRRWLERRVRFQHPEWDTPTVMREVALWMMWGVSDPLPMGSRFRRKPPQVSAVEHGD